MTFDLIIHCGPVTAGFVVGSIMPIGMRSGSVFQFVQVVDALAIAS